MGIALFLIVAAVYLAFAGGLARRSITMPMVFLGLGLVIGLLPASMISAEVQTETLQLLAELTLAMILFADASMLNLRAVWQDRQLPGRLLGIGLPLTIGLGAIVAGLLFPTIPLGMMLLIAAILAPTDAALGLPVFTDKRIPTRVRNALNVESGLNDGIAGPFVILFLSLTLAEEGVVLGDWLLESVIELVVGVLVGLVVGWLGGRMMWYSNSRGWGSGTSGNLAILALALASYTLAQAFGGNGFVSTFVGGIIFGAATQRKLVEETEFTEDVGTLLSLAVWSIFGALIGASAIRDGVANLDWRPIVYALLSLTVVRMIPVALSMIGTGLRRDTVALMGWFGPRGLASVVFGLLAIIAFDEAGQSIEPLVATVGWTVILSVFAHGLSAQPLVGWYSRRLEAAEAAHTELEETPELQSRRQMLMGHSAE